MLPTQTGLQNNRPISFAVDDVVQPTSLLWTEPLDIHVFKRFLRKALILPDAEQAVANALVDRDLTRVRPRALFPEEKSQIEKTQVSKVHPLIETVDTAFAQHRPLTLSPDCIWLAMQQGFVHHIRKNPEAYRHRLVRHQGKETLQTTCGGLTVADFAPAIADISSQIRERTDPVLHETLVCDFSTTTSTIRTASEVVLMDCYSDYFEYSMECVCGIPKVTLLGTLADWQRVRARVEVLETFDLSWWVTRLRPILDEFVQTAAGQPNLPFWKAIYKPEEAYESTTVTGWIADLFPYLNSPRGRSRNSLLDHPRENWLVPFRRQRSPVFDLPGANG